MNGTALLEERAQLINSGRAAIADAIVRIEQQTDYTFGLFDLKGISTEALADCLLILRYGFFACRELPTVK
jgi:hypothetical protein